MFQDAYVKLNKQETAKIVDSLSLHLDGSSIDPALAVVMSRELPFYPGSKFLDLADHRTMPPARRFVIIANGNAHILDFTNQPIYQLNESYPIKLTLDNVTDYVRFFFSFVRGRHGRFLIIESVDDIPWREEPAPSGRKAIGKMVAPMNVTEIPAPLGAGHQKTYHLTAYMLFKDSLFRADIEVADTGQVKILQETLLIEDIPVIDDTLGQ